MTVSSMRRLIWIGWGVCFSISVQRFWTTNSNQPLSETATKAESKEDTAQPQTFAHSDIIYGHIHIAKTGGSVVNGMFANRFERVCGNKGHSVDAYVANEKFKKVPPNKRLAESQKEERQSSIFGFENCDYISNEWPYSGWYQFENFHNLTMELHLPCRDPIDHIMSQCNHKPNKMRTFKCHNGTDEEIAASANHCLLHLMLRFRSELANMKRSRLKCYDFRKQFTTYVDVMSNKLQPRRIVSDYVNREMNRPRNKENECIWKHDAFRSRVEKYLVENVDYYKFCNQCLGSKDDLTAIEDGR